MPTRDAIRQSLMRRIIENVESTKRQYAALGRHVSLFTLFEGQRPEVLYCH